MNTKFWATLGRAAAIAGILAVGVAAPSYADDNLEADESFSRLLYNSGVLFNFTLEKRQGQRFCESVIEGDDPLVATQDLMQKGAYSFDVANGITSAATVAYCTCAVMTAQGMSVDPILCRPFELAYQREYYG